MPAPYFSDRELGPRPRTQQEITEVAWGGIVAIIRKCLGDGSFGYGFPEECPDGEGPCGANQDDFSLALRAEIPEIEWPLQGQSVPPTLAALDLLEFCHRAVARAIQGSYHGFFRHHHLTFDPQAGQETFCANINRVFARNELAYELTPRGEVVRLAPPVLRETLASALFHTEDTQLDGLLETARARFLDPDPTARRDGLEKLWDAWERLKTIEPAKDKKASTAALLDRVTSESALRETLDREALELTRIGNTFQIRHSETSQTPLQLDENVDYMFHRLFAFIHHALRITDRAS
jgi:hypothetical protein